MLLSESGIENRHGLAVPGALLLVLVTVLTLAGEQLSVLESSYYDFLQGLQSRPGSDRILVIDTASDTERGDLWDTAFLPSLINTINAAGAALIVPVDAPPANTPALDIDQLTALAALEDRARQTGASSAENDIVSLDDHLAKLREQFKHQAEIASIVKAAGNIVLPISDNRSKWSREGNTDVCQRHALPAASATLLRSTAQIKETLGILTLPDLLCDSAARAGYGEYWPDSDGIVRRTHLLVKSGTRIFPALSLAVAQATGDGDKFDSGLIVDKSFDIRINDQRFSTGPEFSNLIRFYRADDDAQVFPTISARELLNGEAPTELLKDRIVLIGDMQSESSAEYRISFGKNVTATLLLATALSNLLQMDFLLRPRWLGSAEIAILLVLGIAILLSVPSMNNNRAVGIIGLLVVMLLATEAYLLLAHGVWIQLVTATLFVVLGIASVQSMSKFRRKTSPASTAAPARTPVAPLDSEDQLDLAFSVLRQQPPTETTKKRLYAIAVTHGKLREYAKAERVLIYLAAIDPHYRDVEEKLKKLSGARKDPAGSSKEAADKATPGKSNKSSHTKKTLGRYQLDSVLGRGAMATVYLGTDPSINRRVAIKTIALAEEFSDADLDAAKTQFKREAESAGRLNHPNIIAIYDTGEDGNVAYLAMEYFDAKPLNYYAQSANLLPPKWVLELCARAADALHYAHGQGVVHRDIKPANLLYDAASDMLKITDFGIARLTDTSRTKTGIILGTPSYMSPEQLSASAITGKSDLYSLGITMYQLLTGTTPFRSDSIPKLMDKILNEKHKPVSGFRDDVPLCVDVVLDQALAKNADDRFPNGRAMALALRDCCSSFEGR